MNPQNSPNPSGATGASTSSSVAETSDTLSETKNRITQTARETASKVKDAASSTALRAKEEAQRFATEKKETAANRITSYSSAIHDTARSLEEQDPNIAWFTHRTADRLQSIADYVRNRDFATLRQDAEDMARRHPAVFFGGMFLAGLVVGNFVKASRKNLERQENQDYTRGGDYETDWSESVPQTGVQQELSEAERSAAGI
jgi:hypothetical protein